MTHFDTLAYARALKDAGVPEQQAEAHAEALRDIVTDEVATKADLAAVEANLKTDIAELKGEINLLKWMMGFVLAMLAALLWLTIREAV